MEFYKTFEQKLNKSGLGVVTRKTPSLVGVTLTREGEKYVRGQVQEMYTPMYEIAAYKCDLSEITGIAFQNESKTNAQVEYTEKCKPTPFGELGLYKDNNKGKQFTRNIKSHLKYYDDGWRLAE